MKRPRNAAQMSLDAKELRTIKKKIVVNNLFEA